MKQSRFSRIFLLFSFLFRRRSWRHREKLLWHIRTVPFFSLCNLGMSSFFIPSAKRTATTQFVFLSAHLAICGWPTFLQCSGPVVVAPSTPVPFFHPPRSPPIFSGPVFLFLFRGSQSTRVSAGHFYWREIEIIRGTLDGYFIFPSGFVFSFFLLFFLLFFPSTLFSVAIGDWHLALFPSINRHRHRMLLTRPFIHKFVQFWFPNEFVLIITLVSHLHVSCAI